MTPFDHATVERLLHSALVDGVTDEEWHDSYLRGHDRLDRLDKLRADHVKIMSDVLDRLLTHCTLAAADDIQHWETILYHRRMRDA